MNKPLILGKEIEMCKYCETPDSRNEGYCEKQILEASEKNNIEINLFICKTKGHELEIVGVHSFDYDASVFINFCPMCGRKLRIE